MNILKLILLGDLSKMNILKLISKSKPPKKIKSIQVDKKNSSEELARKPHLVYLSVMNYYNNQIIPKFISKSKPPKKKNQIDTWKGLTSDEAKVALAFNYYDYEFSKVWVSDTTIGIKCRLSRVKVNAIKNHSLQDLVAVRNRGANRTCITKVLNNVFKNPDLIYFLMNQITALRGVFKYHFTRFIKISYMKILSNTFRHPKNGIMLLANLTTLNVLHELNKVINNGRFSKLENLKFSIKQELSLGVYPLSALRYANSIIGSYPIRIRNKFAMTVRLCDYYVKLHDLATMSHLRFFLQDMFKNVKFLLKKKVKEVSVEFHTVKEEVKKIIKKEIPANTGFLAGLEQYRKAFVSDG